jgi:hypothetical protein
MIAFLHRMALEKGQFVRHIFASGSLTAILIIASTTFQVSRLEKVNQAFSAMRLPSFLTPNALPKHSTMSMENSYLLSSKLSETTNPPPISI